MRKELSIDDVIELLHSRTPDDIQAVYTEQVERSKWRKSVAVYGSKQLEKLPFAVKRQMDTYMKYEFWFVCGEYSGCDLLVKKYLQEKKYRKVIAYASNDGIAGNRHILQRCSYCILISKANDMKDDEIYQFAKKHLKYDSIYEFNIPPEGERLDEEEEDEFSTEYKRKMYIFLRKELRKRKRCRKWDKMKYLFSR